MEFSRVPQKTHLYDYESGLTEIITSPICQPKTLLEKLQYFKSSRAYATKGPWLRELQANDPDLFKAIVQMLEEGKADAQDFMAMFDESDSITDG